MGILKISQLCKQEIMIASHAFCEAFIYGMSFI